MTTYVEVIGTPGHARFTVRVDLSTLLHTRSGGMLVGAWRFSANGGCFRAQKLTARKELTVDMRGMPVPSWYTVPQLRFHQVHLRREARLLGNTTGGVCGADARRFSVTYAP